jgi:transposase
MLDEATGFAIAGELRQTRDRLTFAGHRLVGTAESAPRPDASGWAGPAGWAYQHALAVVAREVEAAVELLRSAADLTSAALYEMGQGD